MFRCEKVSRRGTEYRQLLAARGHRGLEAAQIRHQRRIAHAGAPGRTAHHRVVIGHLRDTPRRDEGGGLDALESRIGEPPQQLELDVGWHQIGLVLQAIARTHLDDLHAGRQSGGRGRLVHEGTPAARAAESVSSSISSIPS